MTARWRFVKMQGLGNDFVVLDGVRQQLVLTPQRVRALADRRYGIGCDQVLVVAPASVPEADFDYRIFNADGSEARQCGNGARCVARFIWEEGLSTQRRLRLATLGGFISAELQPDGLVSVEMGEPRFAPEAIPLNPEALDSVTRRELAVLTAEKSYPALLPLELAGERLLITPLSMGNPHAVLVVERISNAPVAALGALLEAHPAFPEGVNVEFVEVCSAHEIKLRVFERGVGETPACGSGACAAAVAMIRRGLALSPVTVQMAGGSLTITWKGLGSPVFMLGPAQRVFEGVLEPDALTSAPCLPWEQPA